MKNIKSLPICAHRSEIINSVRENPVTIITADTGSGKSTFVPVMLFNEKIKNRKANNEGFNKVVVTQPTAMAATSLGYYVSTEYFNESVGETVGFKTRFKKVSPSDSAKGILYTTDGTVVANPDEYINENTLLIIDEVHEFNLNIECILALVKKALMEGKKIKVVIMSATLDDVALSNYFDGAPCITSEGRLFPVEYKHWRSEDMVTPIVEQYREGKNILVFLPGKQEIETLASELEFDLREENPVIIPLHAELGYEEQKNAFKSYSTNKIVLSTNVAQTSVTIPDIDAVIDCGKAKTLMTVNGIEGLYLTDVSRADIEQRKGRAGRCKEGTYILCSRTSYEDRKLYTLAEIQRCALDGIVLRLLSMNLDAEELEFFHQPNIGDIKTAKTLLKKLGAIKKGELTEIGKEMAEVPLSSRSARILLEAMRQDKANGTNNVASNIAIILAILEVNGIKNKKEVWNNYDPNGYGESDLIYELKLFKHNYQLYKESKKAKKKYIELEAVKFKAFKKAVDITFDILRRFELSDPFTDEYDVDAIKKSFLVGFPDRIYYKYFDDLRNDETGDRRKLDNSSICRWNSGYVIGIPIDLESKDRISGCPYVINLLTMVTSVEVEMIQEVLPHLFETEEVVSMHGKERRISLMGRVVKMELISSIEELKESGKCDFSYVIEGNKIFKHLTYDGKRIDYDLDGMTIEDFYYEASDEEWDDFVRKMNIKFIYKNIFRGEITQFMIYEGRTIFEKVVANSKKEFEELYPDEEIDYDTAV